MSQSVLYELVDQVALVTLNRPRSLNSLDLATVEALLACLARAVSEGARALILTGNGRAFCSGADLSGALSHRGADGKINIGTPLRSHYNPCAEGLSKLPIPVVIAVNGIAAGGGASLALCGDLTIAARSASFQQTFVNIGLIPDMGATWLLPRLVGRARARGFSLLGAPISAEKAADWGLIWEMVEDELLLSRARELATQLAELPMAAVAATRRALDQSNHFQFGEQLVVEARMQDTLGQLPDFESAVERFLSSKKPRAAKASG